MKKIYFILSVLICLPLLIHAQPIPKYEMRGVWMSPRSGDWPPVQGTGSAEIQQQKQSLIDIFNAHKSYGMNAIFFHVRPLGDALYKSQLEPWSHYLTGEQGKAPSDTNYDPLQFAIEEAHKRGMELHAWLNPYRIVDQGGSPTKLAPNNVAVLHPEWMIPCSKTPYYFMDPGIPEAREFLIKVIMDIVRRYNVDGIHFDDYFYPYTEYGSFNDDNSFSKYKGTFTDRAAWRKNNVNMLLAAINDSIKAVKPWVKFGVSPAGGMDVNSGIFCDALGWLKGNYTDMAGNVHSGTAYIDYILPQLYQAGYGGNLGTWNSESVLNSRHLYIGQPAYLFGGTGFTSNEIANETKTNRTNPLIRGGVYFSSRSIIGNYDHCADSLFYHFNQFPALTPKMTWIPGSSSKPNAPKNFRIEKNTSTGLMEFRWDKPAGLDTAVVFVVYRAESSTFDKEDATKILGVSAGTALTEPETRYSITKGNYYGVTAVNRFSSESDMSNLVQFTQTDIAPAAPELSLPVNGDTRIGSRASLSWSKSVNAASYTLEVAVDSSFTRYFKVVKEIKYLSLPVGPLSAQQLYYWRVKASGIGGESQYSKVYSFRCATPVAPTPVEPFKTSGVSLNPTFKWRLQPGSDYHFQLSTSPTMTPMVLDKNVFDTTLTVTGLKPLTTYFWRIQAFNDFGTSNWCDAVGFKTGETSAVEDKGETAPKEYKLSQNYPNPFNPSTVIKYSLAKEGYVRLSVFDVLGKEVAVLVDRNQNAGNYSVNFDSNKHYLTSGIYFYTLRAGGFISTRKMIIVK